LCFQCTLKSILHERDYRQVNGSVQHSNLQNPPYESLLNCMKLTSGRMDREGLQQLMNSLISLLISLVMNCCWAQQCPASLPPPLPSLPKLFLISCSPLVCVAVPSREQIDLLLLLLGLHDTRPQ